MALTRKTVAKGAGGISIRQISTGRHLYLNLNSRYELTKTAEEGDPIQGVNSDGNLVDLEAAGSEITFELTVASKKNTRNINELALNAAYVNKANYQFPWAEVHTVATQSVTLNGGTPVASSVEVTLLDGSKLTAGTAPLASGEFEDNGDGTISLHADQNGKEVAIRYKLQATVDVQGGADNSEIGNVDVMFYQVSGSSDQNNKKGVDILWLPKCSIGGDATFLFSNEVQDKEFVLKPVIPDSPAGWTVPYQFIRDLEIDNRNAG